MVETTPCPVTAKSRPQIVDTISLIGSQRVRFGSCQSVLPRGLCIISEIKIKPTSIITTLCIIQRKSRIVKGITDNVDRVTFDAGVGAGRGPFRRRIRLRPLAGPAVPLHCTDQTEEKRDSI